VHGFICTCAERVVPGSVTQRLLCLLHPIWLSKAARARMRFGCLAGAPQHGCLIPLPSAAQVMFVPPAEETRWAAAWWVKEPHEQTCECEMLFLHYSLCACAHVHVCS